MRANYEAVAVIGSAVSHVIALWTSYFVAREIGRREELHFGDDYCFIASGNRVWRGVFQLVRGYEEGVTGGMEDASFMEIGSAGVVYKELESWVGPEERKKGVVIDEKGFWLRGRWRYKSRSCQWSVTRCWKRSIKVYVLPQCLALPIDALKVPVVSPYLLGRSSC